MKKMKILTMVILTFLIAFSSMPVASAYSSYVFVNNTDSSSSFGYVTGKGKPASIQFVTDGAAVVYVNNYWGPSTPNASTRGGSYVFRVDGAGSYNLAYSMKLGEDYQIQVRKVSGSYAKAYVNSDW